jgi:hypothetical protein
MTMSRVPGEGPEEQIRNALQIVNGLSYILERTNQSLACLTPTPGS